jgi:hypothetical protein
MFHLFQINLKTCAGSFHPFVFFPFRGSAMPFGVPILKTQMKSAGRRDEISGAEDEIFHLR